MLNARSETTYQQYSTYWLRWQQHCIMSGINALHPPLAEVINFLQDCRTSHNLGYSAVNTARSALGLLVTCQEGPLNAQEDLSVFLKGVKNESPHLPRYSSVWDTNILLEYLQALGPAQSLELKPLTLKLTVLLLVSSGHRVQTLDHLDIEHLVLTSEVAKFTILTKLKHTRSKGTEIIFKKYPQDPRLCVLAHLTHYLQVTEPHRSSTKLLLSYQRPFGPVGTQTIQCIRKLFGSCRTFVLHESASCRTF